MSSGRHGILANPTTMRLRTQLRADLDSRWGLDRLLVGVRTLIARQLPPRRDKPDGSGRGNVVVLVAYQLSPRPC